MSDSFRAMRLAPLLCLAALTGCTHVVWYGHSDDRRHVVAVLEEAGGQRVRVDGRDGPLVRGVGVDALVMSADGHAAWPAQREDGWVVFRDGRPGPAFDGIGELALSADGLHLAYTAERQGRWRVVQDGTESPAWDAILPGSLVFGAGGRLAWAARTGEAVTAVVDGTEGTPWDGLAHLTFSADGKRFGYLARRGEQSFAVIDGVQRGPYQAIVELALGPHDVVIARRDGWHVVIDGVEGPGFAGVGALLAGEQVAYIAWRRSEAPPAQVTADPQSGRSPEPEARSPSVAQATADPQSVRSPKPEARSPAVTLEHFVHDGDAVFGPWLAVRPELARDAAGRLVFAAQRADGWHVVVGGVEGPPFDEVDVPVVAGLRAGYIARRGATAVVVVDGQELATSDGAGSLALSAEGTRTAWLARHAKALHLLLDGAPAPITGVIAGTLTFSKRGRFGCVTGDRAKRRLRIAFEQGRGVPLDIEELIAALSRRPPEAQPRDADVTLLRQWVAAELDR